MKVSVKTVSVEWNGEIRGLDSVMRGIMQSCSKDPGFEEANALSEDLGYLARQLLEVAVICKRFAESGSYFGYCVEVRIAGGRMGILRIRRVEEAPPPLQALHRIGWHSLASAMLLLLCGIFFSWTTRTESRHGLHAKTY